MKNTNTGSIFTAASIIVIFSIVDVSYARSAAEQCASEQGSVGVFACDRAINENPRDHQSFFNRGMLRYTQGDLDAAIRDYSEAIRMAPTDSRYYSARGDAWFLSNDNDMAIADYNTAIRLDPNDPGHFDRLGGNPPFFSGVLA